MKTIEIKKIVEAIETSDGAGVKLKRSIGTPEILNSLVVYNKFYSIFDDIFYI